MKCAPATDSPLARRGARLLVAGEDHAVELRVQPLDPLDRAIDQLGRRDIALGDELRLRSRIQPREIFDVHAVTRIATS